jgi:hypothetical protein
MMSKTCARASLFLLVPVVFALPVHKSSESLDKLIATEAKLDELIARKKEVKFQTPVGADAASLKPESHTGAVTAKSQLNLSQQQAESISNLWGLKGVTSAASYAQNVAACDAMMTSGFCLTLKASSLLQAPDISPTADQTLCGVGSINQAWGDYKGEEVSGDISTVYDGADTIVTTVCWEGGPTPTGVLTRMEIKLVDVGGVTKTSGVTSQVLSVGCATSARRKHTGAVTATNDGTVSPDDAVDRPTIDGTVSADDAIMWMPDGAEGTVSTMTPKYPSKVSNAERMQARQCNYQPLPTFRQHYWDKGRIFPLGIDIKRAGDDDEEPIYGIFGDDAACRDGKLIWGVGQTWRWVWQTPAGDTCASMREKNEGDPSIQDIHGNYAGEFCCQFCPLAVFPAPNNWPTNYKCRAEASCLKTSSRASCEACTQTWWNEDKKMCMETCQRTKSKSPNDVGRIPVFPAPDSRIWDYLWRTQRTEGQRCDYGEESPWC